VVITHYQPTLLQAAAAAGGGTFIPAEASDKATRIKAALSKLRTGARSTQTGDTQTPRFQFFLLPAILLLWLDTVLVGRRARRRRRAASAETAVAAGLLMAFVVQGCAPARESIDGVAAYNAKDYRKAATLLAQNVQQGDRTPGALYNYGTALLAADSTAAAAEVLDKAAEKADPEIQYRARFNGGLAHLLRGRAAQGDSASGELKAALSTYKRVLLQRPNDLDAKWNYELALEKQKKGGGGGGGGGQSNAAPSPADQQPKPQPTLAQRQAEQLLGSAEREERDVQSKKQKSNHPEPPPGGKDW
jgi:Ca-activated chloride channel family protein